ncbi:MAG: RsmE family RNA methyltransferase [Phycisphaerae bacterium]
MSKPRFYCAKLTPGIVTLDQRESKHALQSLRLHPGDELILFDGRGRLAHGVLQLGDDAVNRRESRRAPATKMRRALVTVERVLCEPPPTRTLTLIVAGCKGSRLAWMVEKLTELGTTRIVIAAFERAVVRAGEAHAAKLRRTALEAAKQSHGVWLPEITCGVALARALADRPDGGLLVAHPVDEAPPLFNRLYAHDLADQHLTAVVGPEGGLTAAEIAMLREGGGELVRLASSILRIETAAISVAANWAARQPG